MAASFKIHVHETSNEDPCETVEAALASSSSAFDGNQAAGRLRRGTGRTSLSAASGTTKEFSSSLVSSLISSGYRRPGSRSVIAMPLKTADSRIVMLQRTDHLTDIEQILYFCLL
jgi:hypothetical protein